MMDICSDADGLVPRSYQCDKIVSNPIKGLKIVDKAYELIKEIGNDSDKLKKFIEMHSFQYYQDGNGDLVLYDIGPDASNSTMTIKLQFNE